MIGRTQLGQVEHDEELKAETAAPNASETEAVRHIVDEVDNLCDEKNWSKLRALFAAEVDADFTSLDGGESARVSGDEFVGAWEKNLYSGKKTFHQRTNHRIEIDGDTAFVTSKAYAFNLIESGEQAGMCEVWGVYTHTLHRVEGNWLISGMTLDVVHQRGDERVRTFTPNA